MNFLLFLLFLCYIPSISGSFAVFPYFLDITKSSRTQMFFKIGITGIYKTPLLTDGCSSDIHLLSVLGNSDFFKVFQLLAQIMDSVYIN